MPDRASFRSAALRVDVALSNHDAEVLRRDGYWVVRTAHNPTFWWGNCLIFDDVPRPGDHARWEAIFRREHPGAEHRVYRCDVDAGGVGDSAPFLADGFEVDEYHVLTARAVAWDGALRDDLEIRPTLGDRDWAERLELNVICDRHDDGHHGDDHVAFVRGRNDTWRWLQQQGAGEVWAAYLEGQRVCELGLFRTGSYLGVQDVKTHPAHRRRGICRRLLLDSCRHALAHHPGSTLMMYAVDDYHATTLYQSIGFAVTGRFVDYGRPPRGYLEQPTQQ